MVKLRLKAGEQGEGESNQGEDDKVGVNLW